MLDPVLGIPAPILVGLVAGLGDAIGEFSGYALGYAGGDALRHRAIYATFEGWMERNGLLTIFLMSTFPNPFFDLVGAAAGSMRMPARRFFLATLARQDRQGPLPGLRRYVFGGHREGLAVMNCPCRTDPAGVSSSGGTESRRRMTIGGIIVAAGSSVRMGGRDKLLLSVGGRPLIAHSIAQLDGHERISALVVVASEANIEAMGAIAAQFRRAKVVLGGKRRRDSVLYGLEALDDCDIVIVHDGARPLLTRALIDAAIDGALEAGAALCAVPVSDTVKRGDAAGLVRSTVSREDLWLAQTPQAFRVDVLRRAHAAHDIDATDDAALVELIEEPVRLVTGSRENIKVTTPEDLALVEALLAARGYTAS